MENGWIWVSYYYTNGSSVIVFSYFIYNCVLVSSGQRRDQPSSRRHLLRPLVPRKREESFGRANRMLGTHLHQHDLIFCFNYDCLYFSFQMTLSFFFLQTYFLTDVFVYIYFNITLLVETCRFSVGSLHSMSWSVPYICFLKKFTTA